MDKLEMINTIQRIYTAGGNIISYLRDMDERSHNTLEDILISYDFQAGNYNLAYKNDPERYAKIHDTYARIINLYLPDDMYSLCEAGVGEGTTFLPVMKRLKAMPAKAFGFDISWSRIAEAISFAQDFSNFNVGNPKFIIGDLFETPFADSSIDIVYTSHALEPNGGKERQLLAELYRITSKYLILFEPIYEFASCEGKKRMEKHGYIRGLKYQAEELGYRIIQYEKLEICQNPLNPTGVLVIEKLVPTEENDLCDPVSKKELHEFADCYYCQDSMLAYPKIGNIPCLTRQHAVLATKFTANMSNANLGCSGGGHHAE